jgi:predicted nucleic acid-binding protein
MIIVDTNTIAYLFLEGQHSQEAEALLKHYPIWIAPILWRSEFRNVLALYIRKKILPYPDALKLMKQAEKLMQGNEHTVSSDDILELVKHSTCSAYDCEFVALARELEMPLVTADKKILAAFPKDCLSMQKALARSTG